jgi:hypothetical protein
MPSLQLKWPINRSDRVLNWYHHLCFQMLLIETIFAKNNDLYSCNWTV